LHRCSLELQITGALHISSDTKVILFPQVLLYLFYFYEYYAFLSALFYIIVMTLSMCLVLNVAVAILYVSQVLLVLVGVF